MNKEERRTLACRLAAIEAYFVQLDEETSTPEERTTTMREIKRRVEEIVRLTPLSPEEKTRFMSLVAANN